MMNYRTVTLAVVGLFLSVSFLASAVVAAEKDAVMMNGKMMTKDGKEMQLQEGQVMMLDGKLIEKMGK